jgi:hypothetical protein
MKLTTKKLYKLIQEAMEETQYGRDFASFLQIPIEQYMNPDYSLDIAFLEQTIGPKLGSGYSRMVFEIDDKHVAKIAYKAPDHWDENSFNDGCASNRLEYQKFNKYPDIFPKSYGIFKEDSVLVVEKVEVISEQDHMDRVLRNTYPALVEGAKYLHYQGYNKVNPSWVFERILDTWDEVIGNKTPIRRDEFDVVMQTRRTTNITAEQMETLWNIVSRDTKLMYWVSTLREMGVEFDELRVGNVATNAMDNKLILIDISKFDFNSGTELGQKIPRGAQHSKIPSVPYDNRTKNVETDPNYEKVRTGQWRRINESLRDDHKEKIIRLLLGSVEDATFAFELMDRLEIEDETQIDLINDAMLRDPEMARNMTGVGQISELHTTLKRKINQILMRGFEEFDLGDFNER